MRQNFVFKKTNQLTQSDKNEIIELFISVFEKSFNQERFDQKYLYTPLDYSYHGLMKVDNRIVGAYNIIPYRYKYFSKEVLFGLSVDTMISQDNRIGPYNLCKMADIVYQALLKDDIRFVFGFPNDSAYEFTKRILHWKDIGELDFHILPLNIGAVIPRFSFMNCLSQAFVVGFIYLPFFRHTNDPNNNIEKICDEKFESHRYDDRYTMIRLGDNTKIVYRINTEKDGTRALYIVDVLPLTFSVFKKAVRELYRRHSRSIDVILYVGKPCFSPRPLLRVPKSMRPQRVRMCGKVLATGIVDHRVFQINNWNLNLSNFDVR
jgi:hypothetical protein